MCDEKIILDEKDATFVLKTLDNPGEPNSNLKELLSKIPVIPLEASNKSTIEVMRSEYTKDERVKILTFYKNCEDISLKLILKKLLLDAGILMIKNKEIE